MINVRITNNFRVFYSKHSTCITEDGKMYKMLHIGFVVIFIYCGFDPEVLIETSYEKFTACNESSQQTHD